MRIVAVPINTDLKREQAVTPRVFAVVGAACAALAVSLPASADVRVLATAGLWTAYGGTSGDNKAVCGLSTDGAETRRIAIQQNAGVNGLELRLTKDSWSIPANTQVELQVQFDRYPLVAMQAAGLDHALVATMTFEQSLPFMRGVRAGRQIQVYFPSGNEPPWTGGLVGSARALNAFNACRSGLGPAAVTQPFRPAGPPPPATHP